MSIVVLLILLIGVGYLFYKDLQSEPLFSYNLDSFRQIDFNTKLSLSKYNRIIKNGGRPVVRDQTDTLWLLSPKAIRNLMITKDFIKFDCSIGGEAMTVKILQKDVKYFGAED